jgi:DNA polymerase-3 subunit gamma/tau
MSYQVLARKWRPKSFEQLIGQEHVVTVLVNALQQQRLHHAYLFTGTRGVGKTTIARIFAKSLNCAEGVSAQPCGVCDICQDIDKGRFIDLLEVDAASRTKVDDTREILDNVQYAPSRGRYKVYLIDEVHMLSRSSFNALLKTLEEPPEHVKFILATTDPQKLPITVLSRCLQFHLKALTKKQIETKLTEILTAENVTVEPGVLSLLAKAARGSMRDSLSLTDQAIAQGNGEISLANVQQMLGGVDHNWSYKILIHLIKNDAEKLMQLSLEIASYAPSYSRLFADFLQLLHQIALLQIVNSTFDVTPEQAVLLNKFAKAMSAEDVQLYYQIALNGRKDLPYAADEQAAFDMMLLRLLAFKPMVVTDTTAVEKQEKNTDIDFADDQLANTQINQTAPVNNALPEQTAQSIAAQASINALDEHESEVKLTSEMLQIEQDAYEQGFDDTLPVQNEPLTTAQNREISEPDEGLSELSFSNVETTQEPTLSQDPALPAEAVKESAQPVSAIEAALQTRNMLRSRKKQGDAAKKPSGAPLRQNASPVDNNSLAREQALETETLKSDKPEPSILPHPEPEQEFSPEIIDPSQHKHANQVDKWAHMIDAMALGGRLRQLAIHSTIDEVSDENKLVMHLDQVNKHLLNDNALNQLQQSICQYLQRSINVEINVVEETKADPFAIQSHINDKRYQYAKEVIENDEVVQALKSEFQATLDEESIQAK